jgi:hypothetical protein
MTRDAGEFSLAVLLGALGGAALALALRDGAGRLDGLLGAGAASEDQAAAEIPGGPRRLAARAIRIPSGVRAVLGNGSRR